MGVELPRSTSAAFMLTGNLPRLRAQIAQAAAPEIDAELAEHHRRRRHRHQPDRAAANLADRARLPSEET